MKCQPPFPKNENPPKNIKSKKTKNKKIYKNDDLLSYAFNEYGKKSK